MTSEQINIAIAEYCGWEREVLPVSGSPMGWIDRDGNYHLSNAFCHDLNAMHEAEKCLPEDAWIGKNCNPYWHRLWQIVREGDGPRDTIHATAAQRAEAFLRTVGKWEGAESRQQADS